MNYSRDERLGLAALLTETSPQAPTLCRGWQARDLVAHLVLRERRPDAATGMLGGPLAARTARLQRRYLDRYSYPELIELFRSGPPRTSVFALPGADEAANTVEHFVHHEDLRRGSPGWTPRVLEPGLADVLWKRITIARLLLRRAPTGVVLARSDGSAQGGPAEGGPDGAKRRFLARKAEPRNDEPSVTVSGAPAELLLWSMGRSGAAEVTLDGPDEAVARLTAWRG
jgi:uncharacterized protein (TIGR03085 family)